VTATPTGPTPTSTQTETATVTPTKTLTPTKTNTPGPSYSNLLGQAWAGVKVYYGKGDEKTFTFTIVGFDFNCDRMPSGEGMLVEYTDGTLEWKDRRSITSSDFAFVRDDDPALDKHDPGPDLNC
jgi:hypothetical protein